jgi:hypothetical protein
MSSDSRSHISEVTIKKRDPIQVRQVHVFKEPTVQQNKLVYQNPEQMSHLTNLALQTCHYMGIDHKDLLHREGNRSMLNTSSEAALMHDKMMEIRRKRRVIQVATKITQERLGGNKNRHKSAKQLKNKLE